MSDPVVEFEDLVESDAPEEVFDFTVPEDVLIECILDDPAGPKDRWDNYTMETCTVIRGKEGVTGAASYDHSYGAGLDYTIMSLIDPPGEGYFVVEGVTGQYHRGDGWTTDDDMTFDFKVVRPATKEDMKLL